MYKKQLLILISLYSSTLFGQTSSNDSLSNNYFKLVDSIKLNQLPETRHDKPIWIVNDIIAAADMIAPSSILSLDVSKPPQSVFKFGILGINSILIIKSVQKFHTLTPKEVYKKLFKSLKGKIIYAVNGYFITSEQFKIDKESIKEIEIVKTTSNDEILDQYKNATCINIWTLDKVERIHEYRNPDRIR